MNSKTTTLHPSTFQLAATRVLRVYIAGACLTIAFWRVNLQLLLYLTVLYCYVRFICYLHTKDLRLAVLILFPGGSGNP